MIDFFEKNNLIIGRYEPYGGVSWIYTSLSFGEYIQIKKTFRITENDFYRSEDEDDKFDESSEFILFKFAVSEGEYYKILKNILNISFNIYFHKSIVLTQEMFLAERNASIFSVLETIKPIEDIYIGGPDEKAISLDEYLSIIKSLPNNYELERYSIARVSSVLRKHFNTEKDGLSQYEKYLNEKGKVTYPTLSDFYDFDLIKYKYTFDKLKKMLVDEDQYSESDWQNEILKIITVLFPKYINAVKEAPVKDYLYNTMRSIDILLVDAEGAIDIVEIKKPFAQCIVSSGRYRDNYIPLRDLSGTIMQIEKYIYHLNKWGVHGEEKLTEK